MNKILVLFAHPRFEDSEINKRLVQAYRGWENVTFRDLYEDYPDFNILYMYERDHLKEYQSIIFHFPLVWFGIPPLLQLWIEEVFDRRWLYELKDENPLKDKRAYIVVSAGDKPSGYSIGDPNKFDARPYLKSLTESIKMNQMTLEGLITVDNTNQLSTEELEKYSTEVKNIVQNP